MLWIAAALAGMPTVDVADTFQHPPLSLQVLDPQGRPVPRAFVRHPDEGIRHPVNRQTGAWEVGPLYLRDGTEMRHELGDVLTFQVSAPGYVTQIVEYRVSGLKNTVPIILDPLGSSRKAKRRRGGSDVQTIDWVEILARTMRRSPAAELHAPELVPARFDYSPQTIARLADPAQADARLMADFSTHLLAQGPDHAGEAEQWARRAMAHAGAELQGDPYVSLVDQMFQVRSVAANLAWQEAEALVTAHPGVRSHERRAEQARRRAAAVADDWVDYARAAQTPSLQLAEALCASAAEDPLQCMP